MKRLFLAAAAVVLAGCAIEGGIHSGVKARYPAANEVPVAVNYQTMTQLKLQSAEHWRRAAVDSAEALVKAARGAPGRIFVRRSCEAGGCAPRPCDTTFNRVFFNEFVTALVNRGYQAAAAEAAGIPTIEIDIQAVAFAPNRPQYRYAGHAVALGPGIWALRDVASLVEPDGVVVTRTEGFDTNWYRSEFAAGPTPQNELVVTVSALSQGAITARHTTVYYIADRDAGHYFCPGESPARARSWTIPVAGDCTAPRCASNERGRP